MFPLRGCIAARLAHRRGYRTVPSTAPRYVTTFSTAPCTTAGEQAATVNPHQSEEPTALFAYRIFLPKCTSGFKWIPFRLADFELLNPRPSTGSNNGCRQEAVIMFVVRCVINRLRADDHPRHRSKRSSGRLFQHEGPAFSFWRQPFFYSRRGIHFVQKSGRVCSGYM